MKKVHIEEDNAETLVLEVLYQSGVAILPTDTLYGFSTAMSCQAGVRRIMTIKGNGEERKFLFLASDISMVERYIGSWGCAERELLEEIWPAPLTAIFQSGSNCPRWVGDTIAMRIPNLPRLVEIIQKLGEPVISTSVNRAGEPALQSLDIIEQRYSEKVDLILIGEDITWSRSSTIVDFTGDFPVLVREGSYPWEAGEENPANG
ncbi:MAG: L-threonylcarbamoyladenylate synthase [Candidatus Latescibacterota bacterium]